MNESMNEFKTALGRPEEAGVFYVGQDPVHGHGSHFTAAGCLSPALGSELVLRCPLSWDRSPI